MSSPAAVLRQHRHTRPGRRATVDVSLAPDSGLVTLENFDVPREVEPNSIIPVTVAVRNDANVINPLDPDWDVCPNLKAGYTLDVVVVVDGIERRRVNRCVSVRQTKDVQLEVRAPSEEGQISLSIEVEGGNTGHFQNDISTTIDVFSEAEEQPCPRGFERDPATGECVSTGGDGNGDGDGDEDPIEQVRSILLLLVILGGIAFLSGVGS